MDYDTCYIAMLRWVHFESYYTKQRETVNELQVYVLANKALLLRLLETK